jgi:hypothetical protein
VGFVGIPAHDIKINPMPKIQAIINILFIIEPPSLKSLKDLCQPSLSSFVMLDIAKTLSLTDVREA